MQKVFSQTFDAVKIGENCKQKLKDKLNEYQDQRSLTTNKNRKERKGFQWNIKRSLVAASTAAFLIFCAIFIPLMLRDEGQNGGFEWGFEISGGNSNETPSYPYFEIYCAYRFTKTEFDLDGVMVQFFYGHTLPNSYYDFDDGKYLPSNLINAESDTKIIINNKGDIWEGRGLEIKQVESFLANDYAAKMTWIDPIEYRKKIEHNHSETIAIPKETFIKKYGYFSICVRSDVTDKNVKLISGEVSGTAFDSRGWGQGETSRIYYYVKDGKVKIGKDYEKVIPKAYWNNI